MSGEIKKTLGIPRCMPGHSWKLPRRRISVSTENVGCTQGKGKGTDKTITKKVKRHRTFCCFTNTDHTYSLHEGWVLAAQKSVQFCLYLCDSFPPSVFVPMYRQIHMQVQP